MSAKRVLPRWWTLNDFNLGVLRVGPADSVAGVPVETNCFPARNVNNSIERAYVVVLTIGGISEDLAFDLDAFLFLYGHRLGERLERHIFGLFVGSCINIYIYIHKFMKISNTSPISGSLRSFVEMYIDFVVFYVVYSYVVRVVLKTKRRRVRKNMSNRNNTKL